MIRKATSYRFTDTALELIDHLSEKLGVSKTAVIEIALRKLAEAEKIEAEKVEKK